ncbi:hypothetical protein ACH9EU_10770 [Kocuria sp. M1R5S2]|uniref:hypothetical protein n=1 Tax=Kocuria rhizosphaerae TaxID=3376285 RepID=UPI00379C0BD9
MLVPRNVSHDRPVVETSHSTVGNAFGNEPTAPVTSLLVIGVVPVVLAVVLGGRSTEGGTRSW